MALWVRHLLLNRLRPPGVALTSVWLGDGEAIELGPVEDAEHSARLAAEYWEGSGGRSRSSRRRVSHSPSGSIARKTRSRRARPR